MRGFTADDLIACYRRGVFPMADARHDERLFLVDPAKRGVIPLAGFHVSHRLARTVRQGRFEVRFDSAFNAVVEACAAPTANRPETWINRTIQKLCLELHLRGEAHSVEAWRDRRMVGGLYGIAIGGAFFGESMFSLERDASKVALAHLVARLRCGGFVLLDAQLLTEHLRTLGAVEISRADYHSRLAEALAAEARFTQADGPPETQASSQAS
ncbi:MAG TPA: leucyl/phenylalanyl-tRNA--protein transferase [Caulobacteraceae bacterium]|jgi:leucyl/phenylalanyl-tRNA--protein transferase|nr:leucyl/phenylalanyl-tRNA--protein transferase [Caulobacteraceae bacterium]